MAPFVVFILKLCIWFSGLLPFWVFAEGKPTVWGWAKLGRSSWSNKGTFSRMNLPLYDIHQIDGTRIAGKRVLVQLQLENQSGYEEVETPTRIVGESKDVFQCAKNPRSGEVEGNVFCLLGLQLYEVADRMWRLFADIGVLNYEPDLNTEINKKLGVKLIVNKAGECKYHLGGASEINLCLDARHLSHSVDDLMDYLSDVLAHEFTHVIQGRLNLMG
ncbi:MAG: hypothetical protein NZ480_05510 [Bdellovibrionaceae bacterium]|nr:hypothetical protein [Pseudobdellovibrionaceae bacterium]MDW8190369.1 hypothetical protein [Pseudobdellovibrionaceae bacterium]